MRDDRELERMMRRGLEQHADEADVSAPVAERAGRDVSRRRRSRRGAGLAAAAATVAVVAGGIAIAVGGDGPADPAPPTATDPTGGSADPGWRTEQWAGLAVDVPDHWGYGGAPMSEMADTAACYPVAMRGPDGSRLPGESDRSLGYVGRPILLTDVCAGYPWIEHSPQENPTAPYVWLGAAVEPGVVEYDNGYVERTVEAEGVMLTVASDDAALRERILGTARPGDRCEPSYGDTVPAGESGLTDEGRGDLLGAEVCAYRRIEGEFVLTYAAPIDVERAATAYRVQESAPAAPVEGACQESVREFVLLRASYEDPYGGDPLERRAVVTTACVGEIDLGPGLTGPPQRTRLVPEGVKPWAVGGIPAVILGPTDHPEVGGWVYRYFIGMQG